MTRAPASRPRLEAALLLLAALALALLTALPYSVGRNAQFVAAPFMGLLQPWPIDAHYHLAMARQSAEGLNLFADRYNGAEPRTRLILNGWLWLIGKTASAERAIPLHLSFFGWRTLAVLLYALAAYAFLRRAARAPSERWLGLAFATVGAGFGWATLLGFADFQSADLFYVEASPFWSLRTEVIVPPTMAALALIFWAVSAYAEERRPRHAALGALGMVALGLVHPHDLLTVWLALALLLALRFREARRLLPGFGAIAAAGAPLALYHRWVLAQEPLFQEYLARRDAFTALEVLAGYGLQAILAFGALGAWLRVRNRRQDAAVAWTLAAVLLLFLPIPPGHQVFPMHALCLPVAALAAAALRALGESIPLSSLRALLYAGALGLAGLTNLLQERTELAMLRGELPEATRDRNLEGAINWYRTEMLRPGERLSALHLPREILAGLLALDNFSDGAAVVLAPPGLSTYIPYYAGARAYAATGEQTVRYEEKQEAVERFERALHEGDHGAARACLREAGLTHLLLLKEKPYLADLPEVPYLKRLWENNRTVLLGVYLGAPDPAPASLP